jgi:hypothetical protein
MLGGIAINDVDLGQPKEKATLSSFTRNSNSIQFHNSFTFRTNVLVLMHILQIIFRNVSLIHKKSQIVSQISHKRQISFTPTSNQIHKTQLE